MNPLMNPVGSNAEGKFNCINAVVITQKKHPLSGGQRVFFNEINPYGFVKCALRVQDGYAM